MENFIKAKETFIESLNKYKSKLKDNPKDNEIVRMIEQCKVVANNVPEGEVITLGLVMVSSYSQLNLMQSQPVSKFPKGGIISKGGIAEPIL